MASRRRFASHGMIKDDDKTNTSVEHEKPKNTEKPAEIVYRVKKNEQRRNRAKSTRPLLRASPRELLTQACYDI